MVENSKKSPRFLFLTSLILVLLSSCYEDREACLDSYATNYDLSADIPCEDCCKYPSIKVSFYNRYIDNIEEDTSRLVLDKLYTNESNQEYLIQSFDFYIRNVHLKTKSGKEILVTNQMKLPTTSGNIIEVEDNIKLINFNDKAALNVNCIHTNLGTSIYDEDITGIKFNIGLQDLSSKISMTDLDTTHFLYTTGKSMYDDTKARYHNAKITYTLDTMEDTQIKKFFVDKDIPINIDYNNDSNFILGKDINFTIIIDHNIIFKDFDFENNSPEQLSQKWSKNIVEAITFNK